MAINSFDDYLASQKQIIATVRTSTITTVAGSWFDLIATSGNPGAGTLAGSNTANGVVPTDATAGFPPIAAFAGGATGYLAQVDFGSSAACRLMLADVLFKAGAYAFNANTTLASQPSYAARLPGGDYKNTELWFEAVTAFTGNPTVVITYTNQDGVTGKSTTFAPGLAPIASRAFPVPLAAGDTGIQKIESVVGSVATVGTFNMLVLRPLWQGRVRVTNDGDTHGLDKTGMPQVFDDSAIGLFAAMDSTTSGAPEVRFEIASK